MSLPPIVYHHFRVPLPYARALQFQHAVYNLQHSRREGSLPYNDAIFLLEHRPVYTGGRRQTATELELEQARLTKLGADFVLADRGGQLTYHGPGQLIGYPLLDLGRRTPAMGIRDYICHLQRALGSHLRDAHGLEAIESDNTGVFLDPTTKIASIGIQVRHRFTSHGFSLNVTHEPRSWFDEIIACGLPDVMAGSIASATGKKVSVAAEIPGILAQLSKRLEREVVPLGDVHDGELLSLVRDMEANAVQALEDKGSCPTAPEHH